MYINGLYIDGMPHKFNRNDNYSGFDILISKQSDKELINIVNDYKELGNTGYVIWDSLWPTGISILESEDRINTYNDLNINPISKELLFFRNIQYSKYKSILLINTLNQYMSNLNIAYVIKHLLNTNTINDLQQIIILLSNDVYQDYKISNSIKSSLGILII
jgi:hypothetical protein